MIVTTPLGDLDELIDQRMRSGDDRLLLRVVVPDVPSCPAPYGIELWANYLPGRRPQVLRVLFESLRAVRAGHEYLVDVRWKPIRA